MAGKHNSMTAVIGIDIGKNVFPRQALDGSG
jgi:hypothetical protein